MKKKIFEITMSLAMLLAVAGYSFDGTNDEVVTDSVTTTIVDNTCGSCDTCAPESCDSCDPCDSCKPCEPCEPCKPCCTETPKTGEPCNCAYNAPARIDPACGWKAWVTASFIYWQPKMKGLDMGYLYQSDGLGNVGYNKINLDFDYKPGFKVGAGFSICRDDWTLYLEYTRLNCDNSRTYDLGSDFNYSTNYLVSGWTSGAGSSNFYTSPFRSITEKWELDFNMFDLELGRPYYLGKKLVFKPHFGMRGGWINHRQRFDGNYSDSLPGPYYDYYAQNDMDTWLIGPRTGVKADWLIGCDFKVITNVAGSLTYQNFKPNIGNVYPVQPGVTTPYSVGLSDEVNYLTPNVEFELGLGYGNYFCNKEWYYDFSATYDFHYFWNQNFIRNLNDGVLSSYVPDVDAGDLMLHGLTITARLDF